MHRIAIFKICLELDSTRYQINHPAGTGTGYLNTGCIAIFLVLCVVWIRKYYSPCSTACCVKLHRSTTTRVSLHDSLTARVQVTRSLNALTLASIALPLLALSVLSQASTVDNAQKSFKIQRSKIFYQKSSNQ